MNTGLYTEWTLIDDEYVNKLIQPWLHPLSLSAYRIPSSNEPNHSIYDVCACVCLCVLIFQMMENAIQSKTMLCRSRFHRNNFLFFRKRKHDAWIMLWHNILDVFDIFHELCNTMPMLLKWLLQLPYRCWPLWVHRWYHCMIYLRKMRKRKKTNEWIVFNDVRAEEGHTANFIYHSCHGW